MNIEEQRKLMNQIKQMAINEAVAGFGKESISRNVGAQIDKIIDLAIAAQNQEGFVLVPKSVIEHIEENYDSERVDDNHSYWSGYNVAMGELKAMIEDVQK